MAQQWPPEPEGPWWNWWQAGLDFLICAIVVIAVAVPLGAALPTFAVQSDNFSRTETMFVDALASALYVGFIVCLLMLAHRRGIKSAALWSGWPDISGQGWLLLVSFFALWIYLSDEFFTYYFPDVVRQEFLTWVESFTIPTWPLSALVAIVAAPLGEELVFRRVLLRAWSNSWIGFAGAAVLSSAIWAWIHLYSTPYTIALFIEGIALCWLARRVRSIWPGIVLHGVNNIYAVVQALLYVWSS